MADGLAATGLANKWLNMLGATAFTAPASTFVQLHTGGAGAAGTSNVSSVTTRQAATWGSASAGSVSESNTPTFSSWAGTNGEVVTDISVWDASSAGNFLFSAVLSSSVTMNTGDTLQLTTLTVAFTPIAA
jgi:hypothetical protein